MDDNNEAEAPHDAFRPGPPPSSLASSSSRSQKPRHPGPPAIPAPLQTQESNDSQKQKSTTTKKGLVEKLFRTPGKNSSKSSGSENSKVSQPPRWKFFRTEKNNHVSASSRGLKAQHPKPSWCRQFFQAKPADPQVVQSSRIGLRIFGNHRRTTLAYVSAALLAGLAVAAIFDPRPDDDAQADPTTTRRPNETTCSTEGCHLMAKVLKKLEVSANICEDFFTAVCSDKAAGGADEFPGDDITGEQSRLAEIEETIFMDKLVKFAIPDRRPENLTGTILDSELQMGKFFLSCHNRDDSADDSRRFFLYFLDDLGIPLEYVGDKQYLSVFSACVRLSLVWGINNPLFFVELRPLRATKHYVTVMRTLKKGLDLSKIDVPILRKRRHTEDNPNTDEMRAKLVQFVNNTFDWFSEDRGLARLRGLLSIVSSVFSGSDAIEERHIREMVLNYEAVSEFLTWRLGLMVDGDDTVPFRTDFNILEEYTAFPWRQAITYGVRQHLNLSQHSQVFVDRPDITFEMVQLLLDPRFHRVFRSYMYVWLIDNLRNAMGKRPETEACTNQPVKCAYLKEEKERYCFRKVREYFPRSYVSLVSRSLVTLRSRIEVKYILSLLVIQSARMIKKTSFMQDMDKLRAMRLLATMVIYDGSPEYLDEMRAVEYKFEVGRNFFQNIMMIRRNRNEEKLITFEREFFPTSNRWPHMPISRPEAYYDIDLNTLTVPATLMTFPHHVPGAPLWVTLAGLGWHVVHKLFHVFDSVNRYSDYVQFRRNSAWDNKTTEKFEEALKCFNKSYKDIEKYYPQHLSYVDEAAIDNAAVYVLSESFDFMDRQVGRTLLPNATGYDYPDVYWIAAVKPFCYTTYVYADKVRNHLFSRSRINYALRDLKKFPGGFKCAASSYMRSSKCQVWGD